MYEHVYGHSCRHLPMFVRMCVGRFIHMYLRSVYICVIGCSFIHYSTFVTSPALALPFSQVMQAAKQLSWEEQAVLLNALQTNFTA